MFLLFLVTSCERDDICAESTATTPNAIIEFYDIANQETLKAVTSLYAIGEGQSDPLSDVNGVSTSSIAIPLRTDANSTTYTFYKDYDVDDMGVISGNPDIITITYEPDEIYVSRACGFKTIFRNFTITVEDDGDNWILSLENLTENLTIEDENQAHIAITH